MLGESKPMACDELRLAEATTGRADGAAAVGETGEAAAAPTWRDEVRRLAIHESAHATAAMLVDMAPMDTIVTMTKFRDADGELVCKFAGYYGQHRADYAAPSLEERAPMFECTPPPKGRNEFPWRLFIREAVITAAGVVGEQLHGFDGQNSGAHDRAALDEIAAQVFSISGRSPYAFKRHVNRLAGLTLASTPARSAVEELASELRRGLLLADLRAGESEGRVEYCIDADRAERIMTDAGARRGALAHWVVPQRGKGRYGKVLGSSPRLA